MSRDQSTEWAEAMTAATATRWIACRAGSREPAIKRVAAPFAPPVSAHRGDRDDDSRDAAYWMARVLGNWPLARGAMERMCAEELL